MIEEKYNILFIGKRRCYKVDLDNKEYNFEHSTPVYISIDGQKIEENSWNVLIFKLAIFLNRLNPKSKEELLLIQQDWGEQKVFSEKRLSNYREFDYNLFINVNHTSVHAVWTIQLLLREWNVDLNKCELIIHRMPRSEAKEVIEYYTKQTISGLQQYLNFVTSYNGSKINKIIEGLVYINDKIGEKVFKNSGYNSLLIIDDYPIFYNMKNDVLKYIEVKYYNQEAFVKNSKYILSWLDKYYKRVLR